MDLKKVEKLIELMQKHNLVQLEFSDKQEKIVLVSNHPTQVAAAPMAYAPAPQQLAPAAAAPSAAPAKKEFSGHVIRSPFVGTFYAAPSPTANPFASVGKRVKKGDTLCIVEAMKLMNEIEADKDGTIKEILVSNGQAVQFDLPLFVLE